MGTLKPGLPLAFLWSFSNAAPPAIDDVVREAQRRATGELENSAPPEDCFLAHIPPVPMRKLEPDFPAARGLLLEQKGAEPPPSCQFVLRHEGKGEQILIPKDGWVPTAGLLG